MKNTIQPAVSIQTYTGPPNCMDPGYIALYQKSYGNDPYRREGWKNKSGDLLTLDEYNQKKENGENMTRWKQFYPDATLEQTYQEVIGKPGYKEVRAYMGNILVGVLQGWDMSDPMMQQKLGVGENVLETLGGGSGKRHYLAEIFVSSDAQGQGISSLLLNTYYAMLNEDYDNICTRTTMLKDLPMMKFEKDGFERVYEYPEDDSWKRALFVKLL